MSTEPANNNMGSHSETVHGSHSETVHGSALPYFLAIALLLVIAYGGWKWWQVEQFQREHQRAIPAYQVGPPITEFELTERSGQTFRSADMRGKVWVVTYFFTTCPGSCIRLNENIQLLHNRPELHDVTWVSITCDPDTDTIEALQSYANRWQADPERWLFCRADLDYIKRVGRGMFLDVFRRGHKDFAVIIDKKGKIRGMFDATSKSQTVQLRTLVLQCLDEQPPGKKPSSNATASTPGIAR